MVKKLQALIALVFFIVAVSIAIPTISFQFRGKIYEIANINPVDFISGLITQYFEYRPALDLQGGYKVVLDVYLQGVEDNKLEQFREAEKIIAQRMAIIGLRDFELTSFYNLEDEVFQLHLTTPEQIDRNIIQVLVSPGELDVLVDNPEAEQNEPSSTTGSILDGRKSAGITNDDILSVKVVSDSRIYTSDPKQPNNFGLLLVVKPEAKEALQEALLTNSSSNMPLIFTLDGSIVAVQASGYYINPYEKTDRLLLYTLFDDTKLNNSVLAATMGTPNLEPLVIAGETLRVNPVLGEQALYNLKVVTGSVLLIISIALLVVMGRKSFYVLVALYVYLAIFIALQKVLNPNLSLALVSASMVMTFVFLLNQIILIISSTKFTSSKKDKEEFIEKYTLGGWRAIIYIAFIAPVAMFFENLLIVSVNQFIQVILLGVLVWLIYKIAFFRVIFNLFSKNIIK